MKVFISSICYDLIDVRAELAHSLIEMGATPILSDERSSDFDVNGAADENSIRTCLRNVSESDVAIFVLSQRYGPILPAPFLPVSATHLEYREAVDARIRRYFYVRDRLVADYDTWVAHGRNEIFTGAWIRSSKDRALFQFMDEHCKLVKDGTIETNNWLSRYSTSRDLCEDVRKRLAPEAKQMLAWRMIEGGHVPVLLAASANVERIPTDGNTKSAYRFSFEIVNAGPVVAIEAKAILIIGTGTNDSNWFFKAHSTIASIPSGHDFGTRLARTVQIELMPDQVQKILGDRPKGESQDFKWRLRLESMTPIGYIFRDELLLNIHWDGHEFTHRIPPSYIGKSFVQLTSLVMTDLEL